MQSIQQRTVHRSAARSQHNVVDAACSLAAVTGTTSTGSLNAGTSFSQLYF